MTEQEQKIETLKTIILDTEFQGVCPPLTDDEFKQLENNILSDGEVISPLIIWNGMLVDGHHRREIILNHTEIPFEIKEKQFSCRAEVIAWICYNQLGRRNLTPEQKAYLIGGEYESTKEIQGSDDFKGNQYQKVVKGQIDPLPDPHVTAIKIGKEHGVSEKTVRRFGGYYNGVNAAEKAWPGIKDELLTRKFKPTMPDIASLAELPPEQVPERLRELREFQEEKEERKRQQREERRRKKQSTDDSEKVFSSISELSASMAEPKQRNDISNVLGIINESATILKETCKAYISEFPSLLGEDKPLLFQAIYELEEYFESLHKED